jgi:hypothetical protein
MEQQDPSWNSMQSTLPPTCKTLWKTKGILKNTARWIFYTSAVEFVNQLKQEGLESESIGQPSSEFEEAPRRDLVFFKLIMCPPLFLLKEGMVCFCKEGKSGEPDPLQILVYWPAAGG